MRRFAIASLVASLLLLFAVDAHPQSGRGAVHPVLALALTDAPSAISFAACWTGPCRTTNQRSLAAPPAHPQPSCAIPEARLKIGPSAPWLAALRPSLRSSCLRSSLLQT